jgi:hypothetical protein
MVAVTRELAGTTVLGHYRVTAPIASGKTADVYEAEDTRDGAAVALKVLHAEHQDSEVAARFLREGKALGLFKHPNVVELLDVGRLDDGSFALVTELVRGMSLRAVIELGGIEQARALTIVRQIVETLGRAHAMGVFHRDVRPENVMLTRDGKREVVKMLDFGVAKLVSDTAKLLGEATLTKAGFSTFGDPRYIAPECVSGGTIDGRADLYSAGVVLFELLSGKPPFHDNDPMVLMRLHTYAPVPKLRDTTPQLEQLITDALAKSPDSRFRSAAEMTAGIDAALHSIEAAPPPALEKAPMDESFMALANEYKEALSAPVAAPQPRAQTPLPVPSEPGRLARLVELARTRKHAVIAGAGVLVVIFVILLVVRHSSKSHGSSGDLAARATELWRGGQADQAVELIEKELASTSDDAQAYMVLGHTRMTLGRRLDGLSAYERAIRIESDLASDPQMRTNVISTLDSKDLAAAMVAIELLATRLSPPAIDVIASHASTDKTAEIRHRARAVAEREGAGERIDHVTSWSLDLGQAATCEERRALIANLRTAADKRAVPALRHAQAFKCNEKDAVDAIAALDPPH